MSSTMGRARPSEDAATRWGAWWQRGIIYQVYPRSFRDSNGDGVGDLGGVRAGLDYLESLGVDAVWLSPVYPSPNKDFGYDITDYTAVDPIYGTLADFDALVADVHARGMRLILDFVPNHTSEEHPWFVESRSGRDSPKRDWFIWADPKPDGGPPNNWLSVAGGRAWELDEQSGQYYYHAYLKEQPDLNWRNPAVREAMKDAMRFWLDRGVDGFRMDVIWHLMKDDAFRDNPPNPDFCAEHPPYLALVPEFTTDRPEVHHVIAELRAVLDEYPDRMMVGEIYLPLDRLVTYYGDGSGGVDLPFNFQLISAPWNARAIEAVVKRYESLLPPHGWPNWVLGNHDRSRIASRAGLQQARAAAMLLLTLRGTPTMYYGDELGMQDVPIPPELVVDPWDKSMPEIGTGRDPVRTPMQWSPEAGAGFTSGTPWLPLAPDAAQRNVRTLDADPRSILALYRRLIRLRHAEPSLCVGDYEPVPATGDVLAYVRRGPGADAFLVVLNLGHAATDFALPPDARGVLELSSDLDRQGEPCAGRVHVRADEAILIRLQ